MSLLRNAVVALERVAGSYDRAVTDPAYLPKKLSATYVKRLREAVSGVTVEVVSSESRMPRGWDFGNTTEIYVTGPGREAKLGLRIHLLVGSDPPEASGRIEVPAADFVIPRRAQTPELVISGLLAELSDYLKHLWSLE